MKWLLALFVVMVSSPLYAQCPGGVCPLPPRIVVTRSAPVITVTPRTVIPRTVIPRQVVPQTVTVYPFSLQKTVVSGRWNYTGNDMSTLEHAYVHHGISRTVAPSEAIRIHDAYHDKHGGANPANNKVYIRRGFKLFRR